MPSVSFSRKSSEWSVFGDDRRGGDNGELILAWDELSAIPAVDLKNALKSECLWAEATSTEALVSTLPAKQLDTEGPMSAIEFAWSDDKFLVVGLYVGEPAETEGSEQVQRFSALLEPLLKSYGAALDSIEADEWYEPYTLAIRFRISAPWKGKKALWLFEIGEKALHLCEAFGSGEVSRESVAGLVRGGSADLLIGQPEGNWLDAKLEEYDLSTTRGKISLAQSVSRFCNAEDGGLIVIGAKAKKVPGGEEIRQVRGLVPRFKDTEARYLRTLDNHLYPPAAGLRIDLVDAGAGRSLIVIDVPPQPEEMKPFLVHGAITVDGDSEGSFISIVQRRGEGSVPITAPMIHSTLAAGRALLRGKHRN